MFRTIILFLIAFCLGFLIHSYVFPNMLTVPNINIEALLSKKTNNAVKDNFSFMNYVTFTNGNFSPSRIVMHKGDYLRITNNDKTNSMNLVSDNSLLSTPRPYQFTERIQVVMPQKGTFIVINKLNQSAKVVVVVQ